MESGNGSTENGSIKIEDSDVYLDEDPFFFTLLTPFCFQF